ncbi:DNA polymerase III PolC-type [Pirellula sp. SH-Sr6A]|uniref:exonuclease domain-containing protein n=1 Tax=Pirellula sp. SH-Sr6A TaxID=1632865 RepID=UPI00078E4FB5|nr:exonuclease domain-containing protein [Pirellula sp. SH-Sr6A]AMV31902.1 DNA polymerase III PolC-type [Pirellula sp. SH-Sr6A]
MERIVAIDFETANHQPNSACQVGLVVMEGFEIVSERSWLIRPPRLYFSPQCVRVHGLTARDCMNQPSWKELWPEIREILSKSVLLGHNVGFDARVLTETCKHYELPIPPQEIQCTRLLAKRVWPALDGHGLANVAQHLGLVFQHHDALEDARASATIARLARDKTRSGSFLELEEATGLLRGAIRVDRVQSPRAIRLHRMQSEIEVSARVQSKVYRADGVPSAASHGLRRAKTLAQTILDRAASLQPLAGKQVLLVDSLLGLDRQEAIRFLESLGAEVHAQLNFKIQYVIFGVPSAAAATPSLFGDGTFLGVGEGTDPEVSRIAQEIDKRRGLGQTIVSLSQRQLLALIPCAAEIVRGD